MRVLAIVPAFNEQEVIGQTLAELTQTCPELDILVVDDGSSDGTAELCTAQGFHCVSLAVNCGLSTAFCTGVRYAQKHGYDAVVQFDADGQHRPAYIASMIDEMGSSGADVVIASRLVDGGDASGIRGARRLGSRLISWLIRLTTGSRINDPTSGLRLFRASLFGHYASGFDLGPEPDALAWLIRKGASVVEIPASMAERQGGRSYLSGLSSFAYMARTCLNILVFQWIRR